MRKSLIDAYHKIFLHNVTILLSLLTHFHFASFYTASYKTYVFVTLSQFSCFFCIHCANNYPILRQMKIFCRFDDSKQQQKLKIHFSFWWIHFYFSSVIMEKTSNVVLLIFCSLLPNSAQILLIKLLLE